MLHIRLRQAREIHYPHTQQPYSYESDILIAQHDGEPVEKTLSMNHVHETWDGYRFLFGRHAQCIFRPEKSTNRRQP